MEPGAADGGEAEGEFGEFVLAVEGGGGGGEEGEVREGRGEVGREGELDDVVLEVEREDGRGWSGVGDGGSGWRCVCYALVVTLFGRGMKPEKHCVGFCGGCCC